MIQPPSRQMRYEAVPVDATTSFTFREFRWPRFPFNWHCHPEIELTLIVRGQGLRFVGDSVEEFADGDLCLLGSNTPHCWASEAASHDPVRSLVIQFLPETWGREFWQMPEMRSIRRLCDQARRGLAIRGPARKSIAPMILDLSSHPAGSWQRFSQLLTMLGRLAESPACTPLASSGFEPPGGIAANQKVGRVLGYIHAHLGSDLSQKHVASAVGKSPQSFSRYFRRVLGKTYVAYVNELKVRNACRALIEGDQPIIDVAYASGFNNLSHFNAQFRRLKRTTPSAYRARVRAGLRGDWGLARQAAWPAIAR